MPRDINVAMTNRRMTGANVSIAQRAVDLTITWTRDDGTPGSDTRTVLFPNVLGNAALPAGWLDDQLTDLCYRAVRIIAGIDSVP